jgi:hypothetical protein
MTIFCSAAPDPYELMRAARRHPFRVCTKGISTRETAKSLEALPIPSNFLIDNDV